MNPPSRKIIQPIKAYIRSRPMNQSELESKCNNIIHNITPREITVKMGFNTKKYNYEHAFGADSTQADVYNTVVGPLISNIIAGYNCTVLVFGQTGTGKTYTITGGDKLSLLINWELDPSLGLIPRAASHLFLELYKLNPKIEYTVRVSFIELYNEEVRDLLKESTNLRLYDDPENKGSVFMKGLTEVTVHTKENVLEYLKIGTDERHASTNFSARKSCSHTIFTFLVHTREITDKGEEIIKTGKFHLVDLAGSENLGKSGTRELGSTNKSLISLGKVIKALSQKVQHIPYRDSKLTRILQDSLGGNSKTCMIGTISPVASSYDETLVTLNYASFVRNIANCPRVNINRKQADFLKALRDEIEELQRELRVARSGEGFYVSRENYEKIKEDIDAKNEKVIELLRGLTELEEYRKNKEAQYNALTESFQQSQEYVETITQQLEEKKQKVEQNRRILNYMRSREQELDNTANQLLQVCKTSAECKDIYYSKYETLCDATLKNAGLVKKLTSASVNALSDVQELTEKQLTDQNITLNNIKKDAINLLKKNEKHVEAVSQLANEMELKAKAQCYITLEEIFKNKTNNFSEEFVKGFFNNLCEVKFPDEHNQFKESLKSLQNHIECENGEFTTRTDNCSQVVSNKISETSKFKASLKEAIQNLQTKISERATILNEIKAIDQTFYLAMREYFQKSEEKKKDLLENGSKQNEIWEELHKSVQQLKKKNLTQLVQDSVKDYFRYLTDAQQEKEMFLEQIIQKREEIISKTESRIETDKSNLDKYLSELLNTVQGNLSLFNQDLETFMNKWAEQANAVKTNVIEITESTYATIEKNIGKMSKSNSSYDADVKKSVQKSTDNLKNLKKDAVFAIHAGDTPVKRSYEYPRHIPDPIPLRVLLEEEANGEMSPTEENE